MKSRSTLSLIVLLVISACSTGFFIHKNKKLKSEVIYLESRIDNLEDDLEESKEAVASLEEEKDEMQEKLDEVQHFDESVSSGFSSGSSSIAYTGGAMETKIDGDFEGWDGETIFKMMNGTIWQQASYDYTYHYAYMPDVLIYSKNGSNYMKVEGIDEEIRVTRIK